MFYAYWADGLSLHVFNRFSYKLNSAYNEVGKYADKFERRITDAEKLNLMLYYIEKEHHFTGNGIWREDKRPNVK